MSHGPRAVYTTTLASSVTLSSAIDLSRAWKTVQIEIPTMASGDVYIQGANSATATYRRICAPFVNTSTSGGLPDFKITSSVTQRFVVIPVYGLEYIKVESSSGATDVVTTFNIICSD